MLLEKPKLFIISCIKLKRNFMPARFNECEFEKVSQELVRKAFLKRCKEYDAQETARLAKEGWEYIKTAKRNVTCTIGDVLLVRNVLFRDGEWKKPLDEWLGLDRYVRFSPEFQYMIAETYVDLSCRKSAKHLTRLKLLDVSKDTVHKVSQEIAKLYKEREAYREYEDKNAEKRCLAAIYVEGDGIMVSLQQQPEEQKDIKKIDLSHFMVHEGVMKVNGRNQLINKHRIIKAKNREARDQLENYLNAHYVITSETLLITNSDMGSGYTPTVFKEIQKLFGCKWEHFWDAYHLKEKIHQMFKQIPEVIGEDYHAEEELFKAIKSHDKKAARGALDAALLEIKDDKKFEEFQNFGKRLLRLFKYTKPAHLRGLTHEGIGTMESQNALISDRMKNRKMSWTPEGAETVARMIIDSCEGTLKDLFFGEWREQWRKIQNMPSVSHYLKPTSKSGGLKQVYQANKTGRKLH